MLTVALTGGIGTGKSVALTRFRELGAPVIEADAIAHEVLAPGTPGAEAVRRRFGPGVMHADGSVDRRKLARVVFADEAARQDLEAIVHPDVRRRLAEWVAARARAGARLAIVEIPLLFEIGREAEFDAIVVTACDEAEQIRRVMARDGLTEADVRRRLSAQWPLDEKVKRAHFVIPTHGRREDTLSRVDAVWGELQARADRV
ncbi:MAG: dephospho-CoA kinase [Acidobacteriota bacterium]